MTWFDSGYHYKRKITIDHTKVSGGTDLGNFPLLVSLADATLATAANGGHVQNGSGYDVIFADSTETTKLDHEIERYVASTGTIVKWVRMPTLSASSDTVLYMYFGNSGIMTSQENKTGVWNANYKGVWHLPNGTTLSVADSTSNANNGTNNGATATTGQIDGGANFNGSSQYIDTPSQAAASSFTLEAWGKTSSTSIQTIISQGDGGADQNTFYFRINSGSGFTVAFDTYAEVSSPSITTNVWHHLVLIYDGSHLTTYVDGTLGTQASATGTPQALANHAIIGRMGDFNGQYWIGSLDELRISNIARSGGWIATEYNNQSSPSTFYSVGPVLTNSPVVIQGNHRPIGRIR